MKIEDLTEQEHTQLLKRMVDSLAEYGVRPGWAVRLHRVGEWELCFRELFYASKECESYAKEWDAELKAFNEFFAKNPYAASHMGFPLK